MFFFFFFFNDTATTEIYTLSLHDALPIFLEPAGRHAARAAHARARLRCGRFLLARWKARSEEHTSELQSQSNLVCRLLLEKKKKTTSRTRLRHRAVSLAHCLRDARPRDTL